MRKRIVLDDQVREGLIKNIYVHNVTRYNIYFTSEFREKAYLDLMAGKSMLKIFSECKLPISEPLLSRKKSIRRVIIECGKNGNFNKRYDDGISTQNGKNDTSNAYINYLLQENEFLKKISKATSGVQKQ